jgi:hypothetical protein
VVVLGLVAAIRAGKDREMARYDSAVRVVGIGFCSCAIGGVAIVGRAMSSTGILPGVGQLFEMAIRGEPFALVTLAGALSTLLSGLNLAVALGRVVPFTRLLVALSGCALALDSWLLGGPVLLVNSVLHSLVLLANVVAAWSTTRGRVAPS